MVSKKKKKSLPPRQKRMDRVGRLQSARHWIPKYSGKNMAKGYKNHFGVDWLCAITELQMLGVNLDSSYLEKLKQSLENQNKARRSKKENQPVDVFEPDPNEAFAYIAGYTHAGFPCGITWDEMMIHEIRL